MAIVVSSPTSSIIPSTLCSHEVFISFRGDTRKKFTSHLHAALLRRLIQTYRDDQNLEKGCEILPSLCRAIEVSKISIVVFSKEYTSSRWCLDELVHIFKCKKERGQIVLPIFYDIDPSDVRKQKGSCADAFAAHEERFERSKVKEWRNALASAADLSGFHLQDEYESNLIEMIVQDVSRKLNRRPLSITLDIKGLVRMDKDLEEIECFGSGNRRMIGLWGMGGISNTSLVRAAFSTDNASMTHVETKLFSQLLMAERNIETVDSFVRNKNHSKMLLVMLADSSGSAHEESVAHESEIRYASGKPKIKGVSLIELFTPEQVREHIIGLRQRVAQSKAKADKNHLLAQPTSENSCQLCGVDKLTFEPPVLYCTPCNSRIERYAVYYCLGEGLTQHFFCISCYTVADGDTIVVDGATIPKAVLEKKKNDEEFEEWWVQCDKCKAWQHQICALFNCRRNDGELVEYTCPICYIQEIERGKLKPLPQTSLLGAQDLPKTILSDHIEQRLFRRLKHERQERARIQGKSYDQVPGAEALVVRVVSSDDKKLEVNQRLLEIFEEKNYPNEFPYKSKVILLFQKIEGVEVCLFAMYVQEFGSEAQFPNRRCVYLSHLDSVQHFRPNIKAVTGVALCTFVYHEILIGYLEYCKKRGFTSCYIWACPPLKDEDFILYRHPEFQKSPKSDDLREWYLSMLRKAAVENIVVNLTNLYDQFFVSAGERKAKITAARLPYFDGDYWTGAVDDLIIKQLHQEDDSRKQNNKGIIKKKIVRKRVLDSTGSDSKDQLLMHKLGETICQMKEDFIVVHLQHACSHCCILMVSGSRWVCDQCKSFQICDKCYEAELRREERERHPINRRKKHTLHPMEIISVPLDTKDEDEILESEFFGTRRAFLSLCQGNHYHYDTLRRAKHSSMMVLYHLHNPTAPAFLTFCSICQLDIESGEGWLCEVCSNYNVCNACYQKDRNSQHPHKLKNHSSSDRAQKVRQMQLQQLRIMLDLVVHGSQCRYRPCQYQDCSKIKGIFRHGIQCKTRASGGCLLCQRMWYLLQLHARACKDSKCYVPRCRDLKDHLKRLEKQSDSRRRAAVMERMRQRVISSVSTKEKDIKGKKKN